MLHDHRVTVEQFTKQAAVFSKAPCVRDENALQLLLQMSDAGPSDTGLDVACGPGIVACAFAAVVHHVMGSDLRGGGFPEGPLPIATERMKGGEDMRWKDRVESTLSRYPETRNDNRFLILRIWDELGLDLTPEQWAKVPTLPQPETLRRTRAKIQNEEGRFLPREDLNARE